MNPSVVPSYVLTGERILAQHRQRLGELQRAGHDCERALQLLHVFEAIMAQTYTSLGHIRACAALLEPTMEPPLPPHTRVPDDAILLGAINTAHFYRYDGAIWCLDQHKWFGVCLIEEWATRAEAQTITAQVPEQRTAGR